ncbi:MAG: DNA polymerase III subunit chi [Alphaproteobacteria bacterium]|nr:DNA polymerase III subunit chi [Alphaproteobacteria bacterium]
MAQVRFYHLRTATLERTLPKLLEKVLGLGERAVVVAPAERIDSLDAALWTYDDRGFLPHGSAKDGQPAHQPIWLTDHVENPNGAGALVVTEGRAPIDLSAWKMAIDFIDGGDDAAVQAARGRWRAYQQAGHELTYWTQGPEGGWTKTA